MSDGRYCPYRPNQHRDDLDDTESVTFFLNDAGPSQQKLIEKTGDLALIIESLREKCVYSEAVKNNNVTQWYKYASRFLIRAVQTGAVSEGVAKDVLVSLGLDHEVIHKCIEDSFDVPGDYQSDNKLLRDDKMWSRVLDVRSHPMVTINNQTYQGEFAGSDIGRAICVGFKDRPAACAEEARLAIAADLVRDTIITKNEDEMSAGSWLIVIGFLLIMACIALYLSKLRQEVTKKSEIQLEVNAAVAQYFSLRGDEPKGQQVSKPKGNAMPPKMKF